MLGRGGRFEKLGSQFSLQCAPYAQPSLGKGQGTQASCHENVEYLDHLDHLPPYFTPQGTQDDQGTQDHQGKQADHLAHPSRQPLVGMAAGSIPVLETALTNLIDLPVTAGRLRHLQFAMLRLP